jgi:cobyrinic acid a,c-diamide synthase
MVSAPSSGAGKTSITAAIARHARNKGKRVRVFKTGPDYLDPMVLERASGQPVYQLDLFMGGLAHCQQLLAEAAENADLILVEGVMGLFDGQPSSADLAAALGLPVLAVIDASAMAQTFAALAVGLQTYRRDIRLCGVVANRVGSEAHARMVAEGLPEDLPLVAALPRRQDLTLPERHLGLVQALELPELDAQLDRWAQAWGQASGGFTFQPVRFDIEAEPALPPLLKGHRIAVAQDAAFSFIYPANLDCLRAMGAEVLSFSPIRGEALPACDALWLPGGYPELHAQALGANPHFFADLASHLAASKPLLAECGGMLALVQGLSDVEGCVQAMAGLMPGHARMQRQLAALGCRNSPGPRASCAATPSTTRGSTRRYSPSRRPATPMAARPPRRFTPMARCAPATSITTSRPTLRPLRPSLPAISPMQIIPPPTERERIIPTAERRGLILVHTGDGKGKSTAAFGLALRAHGRGKAVKIYQFMKVPSARFGEHRMFEQLGVPIEGLGDGFSWKSKDLEHSAQLARDGWARAEATIRAGEHFLVVLDEIMYPLRYGWLPLEPVLQALRERPAHVHVVLTGRNAPEELIELADTVTEMAMVKHHFKAGVPAQRGIED